MNFDVFLIENAQAISDLEKYIESQGYTTFALDVETDSVQEKKANLYGIGLAFNNNEAYYIPIRGKDGNLRFDSAGLVNIGSLLNKLARHLKLIGHNIIYDVLVLEKELGIDLSPHIYSDTILQKHMVDEERPFGLKEVAVKYLGAWADKAQQTLHENIKKNGGSTTKENMEMFKADTEVLADYCGCDCILTFQLFELFEKRLEAEGLSDLFYKDEVMPLYRECTIPMKRNGFPVDVAFFKNLKKQIQLDIDDLEARIHSDVKAEVTAFEEGLLEKDYAPKRLGTFPKIVADMYGVKLPEVAGKVTLAKGAIKKYLAGSADENTQDFVAWLVGEEELPDFVVKKAQRKMWEADNEGRKHIFNLKSNDHLAWLLFNRLNETPLARTETGKPQVNDETLDTYSHRYPWIQKLIDYKKLNKLLSTYIDGILERQIDGVIYTSLLQFGTTSGRFSSRDPNLQNIPRLKDEEADLSALVLQYTNAIKRGFVAGSGNKIVNADFSSLEPVSFAHVSGDEKLRNVFRNGEDLYSSIAINMFNVQGCSADKKAYNYLKKVHPELRQKAKVVALACVYGAEAGRISKLMGITYKEAEEIIDAYLSAYPQLKAYMNKCDWMVKQKGYVTTEFGRKRHLPNAPLVYKRYGEKLLDKNWARKNGLDEARWNFKNMLNLGKNHPIQGLAAHIVNRAMIAVSRQFKANGIRGHLALQVHDELACVVHRDDAARAKDILKRCMETTTLISVPLQADPLIADNLADAK